MHERNNNRVYKNVIFPYVLHSWEFWVLTIAVENFLGIDYHGHGDHGNEHNDHHN